MYCDRSWITRLRTKTSRLASLAGVVAFIIFLVLEPRHKELSVKIFYGRYSYEFLGQDPIAGILCRIICYAVGAFMTFAILMLMTERQTAFSYIGTRTMAILYIPRAYLLLFKKRHPASGSYRHSGRLFYTDRILYSADRSLFASAVYIHNKQDCFLASATASAA